VSRIGEIVTARQLGELTRRMLDELPDEMTIRRDLPGTESPTGGGSQTVPQTVDEMVPVLVEQGAAGVTTTAEQLEEGMVLTLRCERARAPRSGDTVYVTRSGGREITDPAPIRVLGVSEPRSFEALALVTGRQVRG
jgi:hypothetical protein